ncbi:MAG: amino acid ABC transporter substrate-binding protein [Pseudomonadota bacterium]
MKRILSLLLPAAFLLATPAMAQQTLTAVKARGSLTCGVSQGLVGFSNPDEKGAWTGLDVDYCKAFAAAIFGDASKIKYIPLSAKDRFTALQSGEIDVLTRNSTLTMSRDTTLGLDFPVTNYYDGQGFLVRKSLNIKSAKELNGASICTQTGTTTELNAADFFRANNLKYEIVVFVTNDDVIKAYDAGRCDAYTTDSSGLYAERLKLTNPDDHMILPEIISKEPLSVAVRQGDNQWADIVRWTHAALLTAEELDVTTANVEEKMKSSDNPDIKRLLGAEGNYGEGVGLSKEWAVNVIKAVGNYGEMFERNLGKDTRMNIQRGLNAQWNKGGLQYAAPIR